jgi:diguanylate cyclase
MGNSQPADFLSELQLLRTEIDRLLAKADADQKRIEALEFELAREAGGVAAARVEGTDADRFESAFRVEQSRAKRGRAALSLLLIELDELGAIIERWGDAAIDAACQHVADTLQAAVRPTDVVARVGERRIALLLAATALDQALAAATRLQALLPQSPFGDTPPVALVVSAGVVQWRHDEALPDLLGRAARALNQAQRAGGNRAVVG